MQIEELEEALGTTLFERGTRQVRLTGSGETSTPAFSAIAPDAPLSSTIHVSPCRCALRPGAVTAPPASRLYSQVVEPSID